MLSGRYFPLLALLLAASPLPAQQPQLSSDQAIEFDEATQSMVALGNATLTHSGMILIADEVRYYDKQSQAQASGNVRVNYENYRLIGSELTYDIGERKISSESFRLGSPPVYAEGTGFSGTRDRVDARNVTLYFQEPSPYSINVTAENATLYPDDRVEAEKVTFRIGSFPVFYLPRFSQSVEGSAVGLDGRIGYRDNLGAYFQTSSLFPLSPEWRLGANFDAYTERGVLIGPAFEWRSDSSQNNVFSSLETGFIDDDGERGFDILGNAIDDKRWFARFRHRQHYGEKFSLIASIDAWSDSEITRDFRPDTFRHNQQPDNFVEAVYRDKNFYASLFARFQPNDFHQVRERLPEVRFDLKPLAVGNTGLYHSFNAGYTRLRENDILTFFPFTVTRETDRFDAYYSIFAPIKVNKWLNVMPVAGGRLTHYTNTTGNPDNYTRTLGEFGFDAEMKAHATWEYKNETWGIDGLRHIVRPVIRWRYLPGSEDGNPGVLPIDRRVFDVSAPPISLRNMREYDDLIDLNVLRLGLENLLQTRDREYGSRNLVELNFYQDILFSAAPGDDEWAKFYTQLALTPARWLRLDAYSRISTESVNLDEIHTRLTITDADIWALSVDTEHLDGAFEQYEIGFRYKWNERWGFRGRWRIDARSNEFTEQIFGFRQRIGNTWDIEYQIVLHEGTTREDNVGFNIRIDLLQF